MIQIIDQLFRDVWGPVWVIIYQNPLLALGVITSITSGIITLHQNIKK